MSSSSSPPFSTSTPTGINKGENHQKLSFSPLLQSALMAYPKNRTSENISTILDHSGSNYPKKIFYCAHCSKEFSIRSSYLRHARTKHGIDTKSQQFLRSLKHQYQSSRFQHQLGAHGLQFPPHPLPPSAVLANKSQPLEKLIVKRKKLSNEAGHTRSLTRKRKAHEEFMLEGSGSVPQPSVSPHPNKKIKLSLKLGKSQHKAINNTPSHQQQGNSTNSGSVSNCTWQQSSFQEISPATSPASKV